MWWKVFEGSFNQITVHYFERTWVSENLYSSIKINEVLFFNLIVNLHLTKTPMSSIKFL